MNPTLLLFQQGEHSWALRIVEETKALNLPVPAGLANGDKSRILLPTPVPKSKTNVMYFVKIIIVCICNLQFVCFFENLRGLFSIIYNKKPKYTSRQGRR